MIRRRERLALLLPLSDLAADTAPDMSEDGSFWPGWRGDLRFFLGCYVAGLAFFLIMLS